MNAENELRIQNEKSVFNALKQAAEILESRDFSRPLGRERLTAIYRHLTDARIVFSRLY